MMHRSEWQQCVREGLESRLPWAAEIDVGYLTAGLVVTVRVGTKSNLPEPSPPMYYERLCFRHPELNRESADKLVGVCADNFGALYERHLAWRMGRED